MVHSGSRPFVRLVACIVLAFDSGSSIFMGSFSKNLALVAVGPWVGQRYGNIITSVIASPSSLHRDGVDVEELGRMGFASVLLADVGLERAVGRPLELPQLTGKGGAAHLVR